MKENISFKEAVELAKKNIERFKKIEGRPWGISGAMIELSKQVGELAKMVMTREKFYFNERASMDPSYAASEQKIAHEITDIIVAAIRIADHYGVDIIESYLAGREEEDKLLEFKGV